MKNIASELQTERIKAAIEIVKSPISKDEFPNNEHLARICKDNGIYLVDSDGDPYLGYSRDTCKKSH